MGWVLSLDGSGSTPELVMKWGSMKLPPVDSLLPKASPERLPSSVLALDEERSHNFCSPPVGVQLCGCRYFLGVDHPLWQVSRCSSQGSDEENGSHGLHADH